MSKNDSGVELTKYERIPFYVDVAPEVTEENMEQLAAWCGGEIQTEGRGPRARNYIRVDVNKPLSERQSKAFVGDRILRSGTSGFKVYTPKAFAKSFRKVKHLSQDEARRAGVKPPIERKSGVPKNIRPKKVYTDNPVPKDEPLTERDVIDVNEFLEEHAK